VLKLSDISTGANGGTLVELGVDGLPGL